MHTDARCGARVHVLKGLMSAPRTGTDTGQALRSPRRLETSGKYVLHRDYTLYIVARQAHGRCV
jgi:hypothetical protein